MFRRHAPIEPRLDGGLSGNHTGTVDSISIASSCPTNRPNGDHASPPSGAVYGLGILRSADPACCQNMFQLFRPINHRA